MALVEGDSSSLEMDAPEIPSDYTYCPDHDECFLAFMQLLPRGTAWDNTELSLARGSVIRQFMSGLALSWLHFEDAMCISLDEWWCRTSDEDIDLWAADFGIPDECDIYNMSLCAKVEHAAGATPTAQYLLDLLAANGYIGVGRWLTGDDYEFPGIYSTFRFMIDTTLSPAFMQGAQLNFQLGKGVKLGYATLEEIDCMLERYIPAHCAVSMGLSGQFTPLALGSKLKGWWNADSTANGEVASWLDTISSEGATGGPTGQRPTSAIAADGKRWLTFDGSNDYLRTGNVNIQGTGDTPSEVTALLVNTASDAPRRHIAQHGPDERGMAVEGTPARFAVIGRNSGPTLVDTLHVASGTLLLEAAFGNGAVCAAVNGLDAVPVCATGTLTTTGATPLTIGASGATTPANFFKGDMRHLLFTQGMDYHDSPARLEAWLLWDIGRQDLLPGYHPYKTLRP